MNIENSSLQNLVSNIERSQESFFNTWAFFEGKFGEFGVPGFTEQILPARFPHIFGHNNEINVNITLYRGEQGELLCVVGYYFDERDQIEKPFIFDVHPDHQRQGIGTHVAKHVIAELEIKTGKKLDYEKSWKNIDLTLPSANFGNKYIKNNL